MERVKDVLQRLAFVLGLLLAWTLVARYAPWPHYLFPGPGQVAQALGRLVETGKLWAAILRSLGRLAIGYGLSVAVGVTLGLLTARSPFLRKTLKPVITGLQALPSICWMPLAILWFGLNESAILFVVVMGSLLAVAIASEDGVNAISPTLLAVAGTLGIRGPRFYAGVLVPGALPGIVTGLKLGWSFAWRALMAGELLFVSGGLGELLTEGRELLDVGQVVAVMLAIVAVGVITDRLLFQTVETRVRRRWGLEAEA